MTDEQLELRLKAIEKDIEDIKEAIYSIGGAETTVATNESLFGALQEQVAELTSAQINCRTQCDNLKTRVEALEEQGYNNTTELTRCLKGDLDGKTLKIYK